ncbi:MAG: hypothetical protein J6X55_00455 [Victivallales bacterium]|nr:hypothetical protein [Victivallales bacterium]
MKRYLLACLLLGTLCSAIEILPGGFFASGVPTPVKITKDSPYFLVRSGYTLFVSPDMNGTLELQLANYQVGKYVSDTTFTLSSPDGKTLEEAVIPLRKNHNIKLDNLPLGIYQLKINSGQNGCTVRGAAGYCSVEASVFTPFKPSYHCPKAFFIVKSGHLKLKCSGEPEKEHVALTIWDSKGNKVFTGNTLGKRKNSFDVDLAIPSDQEGTVWSLKMDPVPDVGFEDMSISMQEGAEPILALRPEGLVLPIIRTYSSLTGKGDETINGIIISPVAQSVAGLEINFNYTSLDEAKPFNFNTSWKSGDNNLILGINAKYSEVLSGTANIVIRHNGKLIRDTNEELTVCQGLAFQEIPWVEKEPAATITPSDQARGYQVFQRAEPGFVRPKARPTKDEIRSVIKAETSPGLISAEFFALLPLKEFASAAVTIGDLQGPNGAIIPASAIKMLTARIWRQRIDWNSIEYITAPELLEIKDSVALKTMVPQQYCVHVSVPAKAAPGIYRGQIKINGELCAPYELTVDDFILPEYNDMTFGLYADGERWHNNPYTDEEYVKELRMFRAYGMNALMVYPFTGSRLSYKNNKWSINFDVFRHHMKIYAQEGFDGVLCISLQHMKNALIATLKREKPNYTQEDYDAGVVAVIEILKKFSQEDNWPKYCLHTIDEPHTDEQGVEAAKSLGFIKEHGGMTFNTCYGNIVKKYLSKCLDYRCFSTVAYAALSTEEKTEQLRKETLDDGAFFWWYGSGCYTNGNFQQDCNVYSNRHMLGVFNWRSKATGAWTWTFLRAKGNIYNDFDGDWKIEAKDACICYPMPKGNGLIDTLQWEGCREGIYDYRYLRLWEELVNKAAVTPAKAAIAAESRAKVDAAVKAIRWTALQFGVSNGELRDLRALLISEIKRLK